MADKLQETSNTSTRPKHSVACPHCGTRFSRQPDLNRHITPKIACPVGDCHKSFRADKDIEFTRHVAKEHPGLDSQHGKEYFKDHKDISIPFPGLCAPGGHQRTTAEPQVIQTPAHQPQFPAVPVHNGFLDGVSLKKDPSLSSNTYDEAIQSFGFYNPSMWQGTIAVEPSLDNEDSNLEAHMFDPPSEDFYRWLYSSSLADRRFTISK
ncbi:hypothetical protein PISL3812_05699 [Talaromyces islandicus]|uniref:C2H2-type domain-containing protein n=1 Tax=Talaromyces islandicus TaxID=28573 RepID=A0A0U1LZE5_TALIS|nr:hypothetical protein PISL3812_05699 [Talaromyces islandicus]